MNIVIPKKRTVNKILTIVGIILCAILIPILIVNLTLIIKSFVYPDKVPSFLGYKPFIVLSGSMEPVFYSGDIALVREVDADSIKEADIIAFKKGNSVITHRIIGITESDGVRQFITKGDNNNTEDDIAVTYDMVEGKYLFRVSKLGNTAMFMQTPVGLVVFVALPLILFILYDIFRRQLFDRKESKRTSELEAELERLRKLTENSSEAQETPLEK